MLVGIKCFAPVRVCKVAGESDFELWVRDQRRHIDFAYPKNPISRLNDRHTFVADLQFPSRL